MPCEGGVDAAPEGKTIWSRCYGLPSWMRLPIDRLNTQTNFEEYACSPPETDSGFIHDFDTKLTVEPQTLKTSHSAPLLFDKPQTLSLGERQKSPVFLKEVVLGESSKRVKPGNLPQQLVLPYQKIMTPSSSASPSAENTPTSTPQGSPYIPRKTMKGYSSGEESPCGNAKKWFYTGIFSSEGPLETKSQPASLITEESKKASCFILQEEKKKIKEEKRARKTSLPSPGYKKYTVSNFDLNAVSPTSW